MEAKLNKMNNYKGIIKHTKNHDGQILDKALDDLFSAVGKAFFAKYISKHLSMINLNQKLD